MVQRRVLSAAQRRAKVERDRRRRREHNLELERLRSVETEYKEIAPLLDQLQVQFRTVANMIFQLAEESTKRKHIEPSLATNIQQLVNFVRQHETEEAERRQHCMRLKIRALNLNESMDRGTVSSHTDIHYTDEFVQDFIEKLDHDKEKSRVDFPDFKGLTEELERSGRFDLPPSLVPIDEILKKTYGDITAESNQSSPVIRDSYILFCSVIKEMNELQLEQIDPGKLILWRDAINSGLSIGFKGSFAMEHLKKIGRAYLGSKARDYEQEKLKGMEERMLRLKAELLELEKQHHCIAEKQSSEMRRACQSDRQYFQGKTLSTGIFFW